MMPPIRSTLRIHHECAIFDSPLKFALGLAPACDYGYPTLNPSQKTPIGAPQRLKRQMRRTASSKRGFKELRTAVRITGTFGESGLTGGIARIGT
jgi:hypothetical protein